MRRHLVMLICSSIAALALLGVSQGTAKWAWGQLAPTPTGSPGPKITVTVPPTVPAGRATVVPSTTTPQQTGTPTRTGAPTGQTSAAGSGPDLTVDRGGVSVRLTGAVYSATGSKFTLELTHPSLETGPEGPLFAGIPREAVETLGFNSAGIVQQRLGRGVARVEQREILLGVVSAVDKPVVFEIKQLCIEKADSGPCELRPGPWRFEFVPGPGALDPLARVIPINKSVSMDGITVSVKEVRTSRSETLVSFSIPERGRGLEFAGAGLELVYPDGSSERGSERRSESGESLVSFPPPRIGQPSAVFRVRGLVKDVGLPGEITISFTGKVTDAAINGTSMSRVTLNGQAAPGGDSLQAVDAEVGQGRLDLDLRNTTTGRASVIFGGTRGNIVLVDAKGNGRSHSGLVIRFAKDQSGVVSASSEQYRFTGLKGDDLTTVRLRSESVARVIEGPWNFFIPLQ